MNIIKPNSLKIIHGLPPVAKKGDKVALDSEFFNQVKERLHRPHGDFAFLGASYDGVTVYYITDSSQIQEFMDRLNEAVHIWFNAKYDYTQLRPYASMPDRKKLWDSMLIEQIMYSNYYHDFSLADLARRYLDVYLSKEERESFSSVGTSHKGMTQSQINYSCVDVAATWRVYQEQRKIIDDKDLELWKEIELPFLWVMLDMKGMPMDKEAWIALYTKNREDANAIQKRYVQFDESKFTMEQALKKKKYTGINLGSWMQVGAEIRKQGYTIKSTQEDDIAPFAEECEFVRDVLEFRGKSKLASTYGSSWIEKGHIEEDGCVYSSFSQMGAATGRLSSSKPNVENIPVRETPDFRKTFIAAHGYVVISADWSAQEPRIATYLADDEKMKQIFNDKKDVYIESARYMFGWELDKKDPRRKTRMKPTVLGASYGLTEYGMEKKYGIPKDEGKELLDTFFDTFPGFAKWKEEQQKIKDVVTTIYGRKYWINPYEKGSENNALNSPVQGSGGDGLKIAGARFRDLVYEKGYQNEVFFINFIHDEILVMCKEKRSDWAMKNLKKIMIETAENMHEGIPADVEIGCGPSWHEAHV